MKHLLTILFLICTLSLFSQRNNLTQDADGSRIEALKIAYITKKLNLSAARFYVSGLNLITITDYPADPEVNTDVIGNLTGGVDFFTVPQPKTITAGLTVRF